MITGKCEVRSAMHSVKCAIRIRIRFGPMHRMLCFICGVPLAIWVKAATWATRAEPWAPGNAVQAYPVRKICVRFGPCSRSQGKPAYASLAETAICGLACPRLTWLRWPEPDSTPLHSALLRPPTPPCQFSLGLVAGEASSYSNHFSEPVEGTIAAHLRSTVAAVVKRRPRKQNVRSGAHRCVLWCWRRTFWARCAVCC